MWKSKQFNQTVGLALLGFTVAAGASTFSVGHAVTPAKQAPLPAKAVTSSKPALAPAKSSAPAKQTVLTGKVTTSAKTPVPAKAVAVVKPVVVPELSTAYPMLLRVIPLDVSSYTEAATLDEDVKTPESTVSLLNSTGPMLVHMEAIRRAYLTYGQDKALNDKLTAALKDRYMKDQNNPKIFFDYGYAQLVMAGNKNGLFFLRKANDRIMSPNTSLAYGMAQIDADLLIEKGLPDELNTRKMDAVYKLKDALVLNKQRHLPGIWPTYVKVLDNIKTYKAYDSFRNEDMSMVYVPYGVTSVVAATVGVDTQMMAVDTLPSKTATSATKIEYDPAPVQPVSVTTTQTCNIANEAVSWQNVAASRPVDFDGDGTSETVNFFNTSPGQPYVVKVMNKNNKVIGSLLSYKAPYITEDLEGDGFKEIVLRQFEQTPTRPVLVYRWNGNCFVEDKKIAAYFK